MLALGEHATQSGEAASRASLDLPGDQLSLARAVLAVGKPTAVVLFNGRPLTIEDLDRDAPAILEAWFPGSEGGLAVARTLFGLNEPTGRLPISFPAFGRPDPDLPRSSADRPARGRDLQALHQRLYRPAVDAALPVRLRAFLCAL